MDVSADPRMGFVPNSREAQHRRPKPSRRQRATLAAIDLNLDPSESQLRQFGWIGCVALPVIGWLVAGKPPWFGLETWTDSQRWLMAIFVTAAITGGLAAAIRPKLLKWVFVAATLVTFPIGLVLSEVVMFSVFVLTFLPMALVFRWIGRDALQRKIDKDATTYWQDKPQPKDPASYFRQS